MKTTIRYIAVLIVIFTSSVLLSDTPEPLPARQTVLNFEGKLVDEDSMAYEGAINVEAWFYKTDLRSPADLLYAESFNTVEVEHGLFRVPLFRGTPLEGTMYSDNTFAQNPDVYVDIKVNGVPFLEGYSLGSVYSSVRAEIADTADILRRPVPISVGDIPAHSTEHITSGTLNVSRIPRFSATKITSGDFAEDRITGISASSISGDPFPESIIPLSLDASLFTAGALPDEVITNEIMRRGRFAFASGTVGHGSAIPLPDDSFRRSECMWIVGIRHLDGFEGVDQFRVYTDYNGVTTCRWSWREDDGSLNYYCTANYLIICRN